ncbi:MAG: MBL fold metallo-hydrolase RNA specificity domain-containing protein [Desulfomonilaceae bacterium]
MIRVTCFGAAGSVTGSNYLLETSDGRKIIIDCGLFQGSKEMELRNWEDWGYDPSTVKNLILTHAHIDHSGRIPKIVKDGFRGKIISSPPTVELCEVMLLDSAHVQEMEAEWKTRKNRRRAKRDTHPLYTTHDAIESLKYLDPVELDQIVELDPGIKLRLRNAGHILGSCIAELWIQDQNRDVKVVFSGDLGKHDQLIVKHPFEVGNADFLFIESTYGDRKHRNFEDSKAEFLEAINYAVSNREKVIIPAFALERSQEVLYLLGEFSRTGKIPNIPIFLDSPLAIKATEIFRKNKRYYDEATQTIVHQGFDPFDMPNLTMTPTTKESMAINEVNGPAIIISANGMCSAGRIKHHLKHNLWKPGASIIIAGFQAQGTVGRQIVDGAKSVTILGEKVAVRAKVFTIGGLSAHADQTDLLAWVGHFSKKSKPRIFVTHGEPTSSQALASKIHEIFGLSTYVPKWREVLPLDGIAAAPEMAPEPAYTDLRKEALDLIAELEVEISSFKDKMAIKAPKLSEEDLEKLRDIREELQAVISE